MSAEALSLQIALVRGGFSLEVDERLPLSGTTAVFGPSGSGKSTLLRAIAGFERPDRGRIRCAGEIWSDAESSTWIPAHRRSVGYMFQDARLFPHLDVLGNLRFAERRAAPRNGSYSLADVTDAIDLGGLLSRRVDALSGGERQRVALARTLLTRPRLLLLDEPLAAIDHARKTELLPYLERVPDQFGIPTLYVSHDIDEVSHLADRVVVLTAGRVRLHAPTTDVFEHLDLQPLTGRFEAGTVLEGLVVHQDLRLQLSFIDLGGVELAAPRQGGIGTGQRIRVRIRARDVALATVRPEQISIRNVLAATVADVDDQAGTAYCEVVVALRGTGPPERCIRARLTRAAAEDLRLEVGVPVYALVKSVSFEW